MADESTKSNTSDAQDVSQPTSDAGPSENEMPDADAIDKRVKSGDERKSAETAFGDKSGA